MSVKFAGFPVPGKSQMQAQLPLCSSVQLKACRVFQLVDVFSWVVLNLPSLKEMFLLYIWRAHRDAPNGDESNFKGQTILRAKSCHACTDLLQEWRFPME